MRASKRFAFHGRVSRVLGNVSPPPAFREEVVARFLGVDKPAARKREFLDSFSRLGARALIEAGKRRGVSVSSEPVLVERIKKALRGRVALIDVDLLKHPEGVKQAFDYAALAKKLSPRDQFEAALLLARFYRSRYLHHLSELGERELEKTRLVHPSLEKPLLVVPERLLHQLRREREEGFLTRYAENAARRAKKDVFEYFFQHPVECGLRRYAKPVFSNSLDVIEYGLTDVRITDLRNKIVWRLPEFERLLFNDEIIRWRRTLYPRVYSPNVLGLVEKEGGESLNPEHLARALNAISLVTRSRRRR